MELTNTVTFLFTDIEGSTPQWESAPEMHQRVEAHFDILRNAVAATAGELVAMTGDGVVAAFSSAESALRAAITAQRRMPATGLAVRMAVNTGEARRVGGDYRGRPLNRAARIMAAGHGGQILLSEVTAAIIRGGHAPLELIDLGEHHLRDLAEPERIWQVVHPDLKRSFPRLRDAGRISNNLPAPRSSLVGRAADVAEVASLLDRHRVVTLVGAGGVGKTRLALQTAGDVLRRFFRIWFVDLAAAADADDVAAAIAGAAQAGGGARSKEALVSAFGAQRVLLVLDNCEHVLDDVADIADALAAGCPELRILSTSREPLSIDGEHVVAVRPLDPASDAVDLFEERAFAAGATIRASDRPLIREVCARLDGLPLAVELAAAKLKSLGLPALVSALDDRLAVLTADRLRRPDRHRTMRANIDWSYQLLDDDEQRLFRWLAVFCGEFELAAVHHVARQIGVPASAVVDLVGSLVGKSVIEVEEHSHGVQYRMLESVRAFALDELDTDDEWDAAVAARSDWMATVTDRPADDTCAAALRAQHAPRLETRRESAPRGAFHRREFAARPSVSHAKPAPRQLKTRS